MPYRNWNLVVAIIGAAAVAILLIAGANVLRASQAGPTWRRKLIAAGLAMLAAIGIATPGCTPPTPEEDRLTPAMSGDVAAQQLSADAKWQELCRNWADLKNLAIKGCDWELQKSIAKCTESRIKTLLNELERKDEIRPADKKLLECELMLIMWDIDEDRPIDKSPFISCYEAPASPLFKSEFNFDARVKALDEIGSVSVVNPLVLRKVLDAMERDLEIYDHADAGQKDARHLAGDNFRTRAPQNSERIREAIKAIRSRVFGLTSVPTSQPTSAPASQAANSWAAVCENWRFMESLKKESTQAQREQADAAYEKIKTAIVKMGSQGELSAAEKSLLDGELELLREKIYANPPVATSPSDPKVLCYEAIAVDYVGKSFERVNLRLKTLALAGGVEKLNAAVVEKILQTMIDDVAMLESSESSQKSISEDDRKKTAIDARRIVEQMRLKIGGATSAPVSRPVSKPANLK